MKIVASEPVMPLLALTDIVVFPHTIIPLLVENPKAAEAVGAAHEAGRQILVSCRISGEPEGEGTGIVHPVGVSCSVLQLLRLADGQLKIFIEGVARKLVKAVHAVDDNLYATTEPFADLVADEREAEALRRLVLESFREYAELVPLDISSDVLEKMTAREDAGAVSDIVASYCIMKTSRKQKILEDNHVESRLEGIYEFLRAEIEIARIKEEVKERTRRMSASSAQRSPASAPASAHQGPQEGEDEASALERQVMAKDMPAHAREKALQEIMRLRMMPPMSAEATVVRSYVDWFLALPWNEMTEDRNDIGFAQKVLDEDHYGLDRVKERILEYLAVQQMVGSTRGAIMCLVGPPGVGKTSLGRSVARALGRKFVRVSLGGIRDEAEVKGHRRTYIGALPGKIIQGIRRAGSSNPVFLLDEVDKMSLDFRGDPSAALLEALDPEQNSAFNDHYLDCDYDVSKVMFITTANTTHSIPAPLLDRMELIHLEGYTSYDKVKIAFNHIIPKQIRLHGLEGRGIRFSTAAVEAVIHEYTREAGVRNMEKEISSICRKLVRTIVSGGAAPRRVLSRRDVHELLGVPRFRRARLLSGDAVGVVNGLAWTEAGGVLLKVETKVVPGKGKLMLTGKMGDVMQESAQAGMSYVRSKADELGLESNFYDKLDIHIHIPEGAVPKDGPSAGVTMATALVSALTSRAVRADLAMTGELTLGGRVLPVGGLKEKLLAAKEAGVTTVVIPAENEKDLSDTPRDILKGIKVHLVEHMDEIIALALN
jgi:ATP-dependent Lon protease